MSAAPDSVKHNDPASKGCHSPGLLHVPAGALRQRTSSLCKGFPTDIGAPDLTATTRMPPRDYQCQATQARLPSSKRLVAVSRM